MTRRRLTLWRHALSQRLRGRRSFVLWGDPPGAQSHHPAAPDVPAADLHRRIRLLERMVAELRGGWRVETVEELARGRGFDPGLRVDRVWEETHEGRRMMFVEYTDERRPDLRLGFWWDVDRDPGWRFETDEDVASYLKIWLEEAFHAGGAFEERPVDSTGRRWTWPGSRPPPLPPGR